jgi:hypothetical protein
LVFSKLYQKQRAACGLHPSAPPAIAAAAAVRPLGTSALGATALFVIASQPARRRHIVVPPICRAFAKELFEPLVAATVSNKISGRLTYGYRPMIDIFLTITKAKEPFIRCKMRRI